MKDQSDHKRPIALGLDSFGVCVTQHLTALVDVTIHSTQPTNGQTFPDLSLARSGIICLGSLPPFNLVQRVCRACIAHEVPIIPVVLESAALCIGPVMLPGKQGCWICYLKRDLQRSEKSAERSAILDRSEQGRGTGPKGFLETFAKIASGVCAQLLLDIETNAVEAGHLWRLDLMSGEVTTGTLAGVHDCDICGLNRPTADRSVTTMRQELASLWPNRPDLLKTSRLDTQSIGADERVSDNGS